MKIGVIGSGTMGTGIAQTFAQKDDFSVVLCSSSLESAQRGMKKIENKIQSRVVKGKIDKNEANEILNRISVGVLDDCADCNFVIESIPENLEKKTSLLLKLQSICKDDCIIATNTSSLSITQLDSLIKQQVVGMHFFNPAPVMQLVEVVSGLNTSIESQNKIIELAEKIDKTPVKIKDSAGFAVNRMLIPMINEAIEIYATGIATVEDIDKSMKLGANHPMGPLELADLIGLDVCLSIMETLQKETGDSKYRPSQLLRKMVMAKQLGVKSGKGFYRY